MRPTSGRCLYRSTSALLYAAFCFSRGSSVPCCSLASACNRSVSDQATCMQATADCCLRRWLVKPARLLWPDQGFERVQQMFLQRAPEQDAAAWRPPSTCGRSCRRCQRRRRRRRPRSAPRRLAACASCGTPDLMQNISQHDEHKRMALWKEGSRSTQHHVEGAIDIRTAWQGGLPPM